MSEGNFKVGGIPQMPVTRGLYRETQDSSPWADMLNIDSCVGTMIVVGLACVAIVGATGYGIYKCFQNNEGDKDESLAQRKHRKNCKENDKKNDKENDKKNVEKNDNKNDMKNVEKNDKENDKKNENKNDQKNDKENDKKNVEKNDNKDDNKNDKKNVKKNDNKKSKRKQD